MSWKMSAPIKVHKMSFQSNLNFPESCMNSQPINPIKAMRFAKRCLFSIIQVFELFLLNAYGMISANKAGMPIAGKKLGATPKRYVITLLPPV